MLREYKEKLKLKYNHIMSNCTQCLVHIKLDIINEIIFLLIIKYQVLIFYYLLQSLITIKYDF